MWPFKKDKMPEAKPEPQKIVFSSDDSMYRRAENIWYALGFVNDRVGAVPQIAGWLSMYRDWDREVAAKRTDAPEKPAAVIGEKREGK